MSKWNPDEHLPECGVTRYPICICDRLRACEQRMLDVAELHNYHMPAWTSGYLAGLDAAEAALIEIVRNIPAYEERALTAIRALKEQP